MLGKKERKLKSEGRRGGKDAAINLPRGSIDRGAVFRKDKWGWAKTPSLADKKKTLNTG